MSKILKDNFSKEISFIRNIYNKLERVIEVVSNTKKGRYISWSIVIALCLSIILLFNILTPMIADDFCYLFIYGGDYQTKITSISDIILSQTNHYFLWGGRSVVHFIAQVLLLLPPIVIDILNTLVYIAYVVLIYLMIRGHKENSLMLFILINLAVWFIQPAFGDTILWITGSANYLWGTVLILLFILPYRFYKGNNVGRLSNILKTVISFFFGIIAGWTNENTAAGMIVISILFLFYFHSNNWRIPKWSISGLVGAIIGYLIMILAPGNQERAGEAVTFDLLVLCYRMFMHTQNFIVNCGGFNLLGFIIFILFWHYTRQTRKDNLKLFSIFFIAVLISIYSMVFSPSFPPRAWFGVVTYNIIAIGILLYNLNYHYKFLRQIRMGILLFGIVAFIFSFYIASKDIYSLFTVTQHRNKLVEQAKKQKLPYCEFERYNAQTRFVHSEDPKAYEFMYGYYDIDIRFKD